MMRHARLDALLLYITTSLTKFSLSLGDRPRRSVELLVDVKFLWLVASDVAHAIKVSHNSLKRTFSGGSSSCAAASL
jgi:hypothetical protein